MPTSAVSRILGRGLGLALLAASLVACSDDSAEEPSADPSVQAAADVALSLSRALERRASAVRRNDLGAFEADLAGGRRFVRAQRTYLGNLAQLPLARFGYTLDPGTLVREGDDYWVVVRLTMQLEGYDDAPVTTMDRFRFAPAPREPGRYVLASVTDRDWETRHRIRPEPWDTGAIQVRAGTGVLGVFDEASVPAAAGIVDSVERGIASVAAVVPYPWSRSVVVYALSDTAFLASIDDLPGGDPERLDGVAFPVASSPDGGGIAATRFALSPGMLTRPGVERDRLVRHELTHVAVADRDDRVPVWLSEGIAEYVSVRPLAPQDRLIPAAAVAAAEAGVSGLPADETFNDTDSSENYALAWWACEYVAGSFGESTLWTLLDALGEPGADPEKVLREQLGLGEPEVARRAARSIVATFDPESLQPREPPTS